MTKTSSIPFNKPFIVGKELHYISQAVLDGHLAGNGAFTKRCQAWLQEYTGASRVLLTQSCTAALEMAALIFDLKAGDEVIMPSYTFVSTANAFVLRGARPSFVDICPQTLNINPELIESAITKSTKAIVPVHYSGVACDMDAIREISDRHGLRIIEDAAQAVDATFHGKPLGTLGDLGCFSFHETKNFISGEGGALVINDSDLVEKAEFIWEKGTDRSKFLKGEVDKYTWVNVGSSYLPSELTAAFLCAQLEHAETITARRLEIHERYQSAFSELEQREALRLPVVPAACRHNGHMFYVLVRDVESRTRLIQHLKAAEIHSVFHYIPLHSSPMGQRFGFTSGELPVTDNVSSRILRLPCYFELGHREQDRVIGEIRSFFARH